MTLMEPYDDDDDDDDVDDTDGTMISLTVEGMAEALNAGVQFPVGSFCAYQASCWTIMSIDLAITK